MSFRLRRMVTGRVPPISTSAKTQSVGACWSVVYSSEQGLFFIEDLVSAIEKNYCSFLAASGEDWILIGIFASPKEAAAAIQSWIRIPGAPRRAGKEKSAGVPVKVANAGSEWIREPGAQKLKKRKQWGFRGTAKRASA
jgi:hypothetical protein